MERAVGSPHQCPCLHHCAIAPRTYLHNCMPIIAKLYISKTYSCAVKFSPHQCPRLNIFTTHILVQLHISSTHVCTKYECTLHIHIFTTSVPSLAHFHHTYLHNYYVATCIKTCGNKAVCITSCKHIRARILPLRLPMSPVK